MSNEIDPAIEHAAKQFENGSLGYPALTDDEANDGNYGRPVYEAADALAKALELFKVDPGYAEVLGISKHGMDFISGAEATLRAASIDL